MDYFILHLVVRSHYYSHDHVQKHEEHDEEEAAHSTVRRVLLLEAILKIRRQTQYRVDRLTVKNLAKLHIWITFKYLASADTQASPYEQQLCQNFIDLAHRWIIEPAKRPNKKCAHAQT